MRYCISIDWLSVYCWYKVPSASWQGVSGTAEYIGAAYPWRYRLAEFGTRQFRKLMYVDMPNEQGGWDEFAEVQYEPCSGILDARSMIVRLKNRVLYRPDMWDLFDIFLFNNDIEVKSVSRVDICADFNDFATLSPKRLIEGFAAKQYRHIGRGVGALYFDHGVKAGKYGVNYTGMSFGTHSSDARVYLYNKSFELLTQGDKPYIRDRWNAIGLDVTKVWRLEFSIKAKACTYMDGLTKSKITINTENTRTMEYLPQIYHTFERKLFAFIVNRDGITNVTREPRLQLFNSAPIYIRNSIRNVSQGSRTERIIIKALYNYVDTYRGGNDGDIDTFAKTMAVDLAQRADLDIWLNKHIDVWEKIPTHK